MRTTVEIPGQPQGKARPRYSNGRAYTPEKTRDYEQWIRLHYINGTNPKNRMHSGALAVTIEADFLIPQSWSKADKKAAEMGILKPTKKPDLDNIIKCLDALNGIAWHDDAQIVGIVAKKVYTSSAKVIITIEEV